MGSRGLTRRGRGTGLEVLEEEPLGPELLEAPLELDVEHLGRPGGHRGGRGEGEKWVWRGGWGWKVGLPARARMTSVNSKM